MSDTTIKARAIAATAAELRLSEVTVQMVVSAYDANRAALKRANAGAAVKPKELGGGWYLLPDGRKVQGKAAAEQAMRELSENV